MNIAEVCAELKISRTTLYKFMKEGIIKPLPKQSTLLKVEKLRFDRAAVEALKQS